MKWTMRRALAGLAVAAIGLLSGLPASTASAVTKAPRLIVADRVQTIYQRFYGYPTADHPTADVGGIVSCPSGSEMIGAGSGNGATAALAPWDDFTGVRLLGSVAWPSPTYQGNFIQVTLLCAPARDLTAVRRVQVVRRASGLANTYLDTRGGCPSGYC